MILTSNLDKLYFVTSLSVYDASSQMMLYNKLKHQLKQHFWLGDITFVLHKRLSCNKTVEQVDATIDAFSV